jgi:hypothetical protein
VREVSMDICVCALLTRSLPLREVTVL